MTDGARLPAVRDELTEADIEALTGLRRPRWQKFVLTFASGATRWGATIAAGYAPRNREIGRKLMQRPDIAEAVRVVRAEIARRARYDMDKLIADLDDAAEFARETENATALVRARELKGKALGLLVDRIDARVQQVPFRIEIEGIAHAPMPADAEEARQ